MSGNWVQVWGQSHASLSHFSYMSEEKTFRFVINSAVSGEQIKIRLSDEFSDNDVYIGEVRLAHCDENGFCSDNGVRLTFNGMSEFVLEKGKFIISDITDFSVFAGECFAISIFVKKGALRSGNLMNNIKLITVKGNRCSKRELINERRKRDAVIDMSSHIFNMILHKPIPLIEAVEVLNCTSASSIAVFGDSLCQQGYWTNVFEARIRKQFPGALSVINKSIMGNRILSDYSKRFPLRGLFGVSAKSRLEKDILSYHDSEYVIISLGVNDVIQPGTIAAPGKEKSDAETIFRGIADINSTVKSYGKKTIVFNIPMIGQNIDSRPYKERMTIKINELLSENSDMFDCLVDQAQLMRDADNIYKSDLRYLGKDKLHYNAEGGKILAESIDIRMFSKISKE